MAWILEPISLATEGIVGIGPVSGFCPEPLAMKSIGIIRFEIAPVDDPFDGGAGIRPIVYTDPPDPKRDLTKLALIAVLTIEDNEP